MRLPKGSQAWTVGWSERTLTRQAHRAIVRYLKPSATPGALSVEL
jgi:hypothetical protein